MKVAHILQSGFLAWPTVDLVKSEAEAETFKNSLYTPDYQVIDTENYYDKGVERLFTLWREDDSRIRAFEFREAILMTAFRVFREKSILPWLRLQFGHSSLSYLHRKFLTETFGSIMRSMPRTLDNLQYYQLLHPTLSAPTTPMDERDVAKALLEIFEGPNSNLVSKVLYRWTKDVDGVCDLLTTLHVIFGKRSGAVSVSSK